MNSEWSVGSAGRYPGVSTVFHYHRGVSDCPGECITAHGPTDAQVVVQLLYYGKNPGIAYSFILPNDVPFQPFNEVAPLQSSDKGTFRKSHSPSDPEPFAGVGQESVSPQESEEEPHSYITPERQRDVDTSNNGASSDPYRGSSYGTHTLGGRGQSYTYQNSGSSSSNSDNSPDRSSNAESQREYAGRWPSSRHTETRPESPGSAYDENDRVSTGYKYYRRRRPIIPRQPTYSYYPSASSSSSSSSSSYSPYSSSASRQRFQPGTYVSAYDRIRAATDNSYNPKHTSSSSGRAGLVDSTFSRSVEPESNLVQAYERAVERRPSLTIGTRGGGGKEYEWTISGFSECSLTCGGGLQETEIVCVLTSSATQVVVTSENCENALKPRVQRVSCNNEPCRPGWVTGEWESCGVTCGGGTQSRRIECRQRFSATLELSVSASQCDQEQKPAVAQQCNNDPCAEWTNGQWGECNAECGGGDRERLVECVDGQGVQIPAVYCPQDKPASKEECNTQPCSTQWIHSHWSEQCSASCGTGTTSRHVVCVDRAGRAVSETGCNKEQRPRDRKRCESSTGCGNSWFSGPWTECSESCGQGVKTRAVVCMRREEGGRGMSTLSDDQCPNDGKPPVEEVCYNTECGALHYMTAWTQCSVTCGTGLKTREVRCLDANQQSSWTCDRARAPKDREVCELSPCEEHGPQEVRDGEAEERDRPHHSERAVIITAPRRGERPYIVHGGAHSFLRGGSSTHNISKSPFQVITVTQPISESRDEVTENTFDDLEDDFDDEFEEDDEEKGEEEHAEKEEGEEEEEEVIEEGQDQEEEEDVEKEETQLPADKDDSCKDTFWNCKIVVQARLCHLYGYYRKVCCNSCRKVI